ncbi:MAG: hypothetical protein ACRD22_08520 [Terriglobia bacterium]
MKVTPISSRCLSFTQTFTYDGANRLATASEGSNWSRSYGYDQYGNMWVTGASGVTPAGVLSAILAAERSLHFQTEAGHKRHWIGFVAGSKPDAEQFTKMAGMKAPGEMLNTLWFKADRGKPPDRYAGGSLRFRL